MHCASTYPPTYTLNASTRSTTSQYSPQKLSKQSRRIVSSNYHRLRIANSPNRQYGAEEYREGGGAIVGRGVGAVRRRDAHLPRPGRVQYRSAEAFARSCSAKLLIKLRIEVAAPVGRLPMLRFSCNMRARLPSAQRHSHVEREVGANTV
jgi:hypothetical protein